MMEKEIHGKDIWYRIQGIRRDWTLLFLSFSVHRVSHVLEVSKMKRESTPKTSPKYNGSIERFFRTFKQKMCLA